MPVSLEGRAADDLRYIRDAMERSGTFTAVPGIGGALMGVIGLVAAVAAGSASSAQRWLAVWLAAAAVALVVGLVAMRYKAARAGIPIAGRAARRFALSLAAPLVAGAALTYGLAQAGTWALMPPAWLLLYGTGLLTGGTVSVPVVQTIGLCFMTLGVASLATPPEWGNLWLALGFGVLQVAFGLYIARKHGG